MRSVLLAIVLTIGLIMPVWADYQVGLDAYERSDYATALREWKPLAEAGDAKAQFALGLMYGKGQGVPQDYAKATKWYRKAGDQGNAHALGNIGYLYHKGWGVKKDFAEAAKWYRKAAELGNDVAQNNLGVYYRKGLGVAKDHTEAAKWYSKAARQGRVGAQNNLGVYYRKGLGVPQDYAEALFWFRAAAIKGSSLGQFYLASAYAKGQGVAKDNAEAARWYRKAAEQNHAGAQILLCYFREKGLGVPPDYELALDWCRKAAKQGNPIAVGRLARLEGDPEVARQVKKRRQAREPAIFDQNMRAFMMAYQQGDHPEALKRIRAAVKAAEEFGWEDTRLADALGNLAVLYATEGHYSEAEPLFKRSLGIWEKTFGPDHPHVATSLENYAAVLRKIGRSKRAAMMEARAKAIRAKHAKANQGN